MGGAALLGANSERYGRHPEMRRKPLRPTPPLIVWMSFRLAIPWRVRSRSEIPDRGPGQTGKEQTASQ